MNASKQQQINGFISSVHDAASRNLLSWDIFSAEWLFLLQSETKLVAAISGEPEPPDHQPGDAEYGLFLYLLNHGLPLILQPAVPLLRELGMPESTISQDHYTAWTEMLKEGAGVATTDGTWIAFTKYAVLDAGYLYAVLYYLRTRYSAYLPGIGIRPGKFQTTPVTLLVEGANPLRIAIFGDWGTGKWQDGTMPLCPSQLVSEAIRQLSPEMVIHLGDVYYYGSAAEEKTNLVQFWVGGSKASFTLNSNHEMYDGANGYFKIALKNPAFSVQQGTSYFAVLYADWIIMGLDSAYFDRSTLYRSGTVAGDQLKFISDTINDPDNQNKKVVLLTHHNPISYDAGSISIRKDNGSLLNDVYQAMGKKFPDYWYYGHLHNGVVYNKEGLSGLLAQYPGTLPELRCMGHAGIPAGVARGLIGHPGIDYFVQRAVNIPGPTLSERVLNGFAMLTLNPGKITEEVFEVANSTGNNGVTATVAWHN